MKIHASLIAGLLVIAGGAQAQIPPSQDSWYDEPYGFEKAAPGTVLRLREAPGNLTESIPYAGAVWNVLFRTTDSQYKPTWAVTTVFVPNTTTNDTAALLSYQLPYDSADVDASPSYAFYSDLDSTASELAIVLAKGWFVNVPDYEGPLASFTAGVISGHATLDSVRAVLSLSPGCSFSVSRPYCVEGSWRPFSLPAGAPVALWGYSGGALASEWATELAVQYTPELAISGAALGGLTPNITNVLLTITDTIAAGLAPSSILGITSQYPKVRDRLVSLLQTSGTYNKTSFLAAENYTLSEDEIAFAFANISAYFVDGFSWLSDPQVQQVIFRDGIMGLHGIPQVPLYVYKAVQDEISPVADTDALVDRYCELGTNILYQRNSVGGHSAEGTNGLVAAFSFVSSLLDGSYNETYSTEGCTIETIVANTTDSPFKSRKRSMFVRRWI